MHKRTEAYIEDFLEPHPIADIPLLNDSGSLKRKLGSCFIPVTQESWHGYTSIFSKSLNAQDQSSSFPLASKYPYIWRPLLLVVLELTGGQSAEGSRMLFINPSIPMYKFCHPQHQHAEREVAYPLILPCS